MNGVIAKRHKRIVKRASRTANRIVAMPAVSWLIRLKSRIEYDNVPLLAAGIAFYFLLAAFPAMAALISIYGLVGDPHVIAEQADVLRNFLPPDAFDILNTQMQDIVKTANSQLSFSLIVTIILAAYSASRGVSALMTGFNVAYNETEKRSIVVLALTSLALTLCMLVYLLVSISILALVPFLLSLIPIDAVAETIALYARWPFLFFTALIGLEVIYRLAPSHSEHAQKRLISNGAISATIMWVLMSVAFAKFVAGLGNYNETYGSLGAVIVLLMWFWLSAMILLIGAEINAFSRRKQP
jgi:membrane protein